MKELNEKLLNAFANNKRQEVERLLKDGADKQIMIDYAKKIGGWNMTMSQDWMLRELVYNNK